jgi:hypothetical protein
MDEAQKTWEPIVVTKPEKAEAKVIPARAQPDNILGFMAEKGKIVDDIVSPIFDEDEWDCVK